MKLKLYPLFITSFLLFFILFFTVNYADAVYLNHYNLSLWDFSGPYTESRDGMTLNYTLAQDAKGKVTGSGNFNDSSDGNDISIPVEIKGKVKGKNGIVTLKYKVKGKDSEGNKIQNNVMLVLDEGSLSLVGTEKMNVCQKGAGCEKPEGNVSLDVPDGMTGEAELEIDAPLDEKGKKLEGTGELTLSNGDIYDLYAKGKYNSKKGETQFQLKGVDEPAKGIKLKLKINEGSDIVTFIKGKVLGQQLKYQEDLKYTAAGESDNLIIKQAQIMTTHIEDTGIEVRATLVEPLEFGGSYAGINVEENWVQPYFTFIPENMSAYTNAPPEINGIIMTKMKSKDGIEDKFDIILDGTQGTCADVQEEIYASTFSLLSPSEQATYLAEGKSLSFIQDDNPGEGGVDEDGRLYNPVYNSNGWLPIDPATKITSVGDDYFYEPLSLYVTMDNPIFQDGGGDERYRGVRYCKLLSHQAILSWLLTKSFEDDPVLITENTLECTDPRDRISDLGSCIFEFPFAEATFCSDYTGYDFVFDGSPSSPQGKCSGRPSTENIPVPIYSSLTCSERTEELEDLIPDSYVGQTALCAIHCAEGNEFIWNVYEEIGGAACGLNFPRFCPEEYPNCDDDGR